MKKGITLISLVITIIILIILATVAINLAVDGNGLFRRAGDTANIWNNSVAQEGQTIDNLMQIANTLGGTPPTTSTSPVSQYITETSTVAGIEKERTAPIPTGFVASQVEAEKTIAGGLVIYETTTPVTEANHSDALKDYNQYVWIPVDNINDMVMCKNKDANADHTLNETTLQCPICLADTELAGRLYAAGIGNTFNAGLDTQKYTNDDDANFSSATIKLREPDDLTDTTYGDASSDGITAIKGILNNTTATTNYADIKDDWNDLLQDDFENMAKSVAKYGGFYISRYEIGAGGSSKKEQEVLNNSNSRNWWSLFSTLRTTKTSTTSQMIWRKSVRPGNEVCKWKNRWNRSNIRCKDSIKCKT